MIKKYIYERATYIIRLYGSDDPRIGPGDVYRKQTKRKAMTEQTIQLLITQIEDNIDKILLSIKNDTLDDHEIRARKKLARDLYFSIQYYDLRNHK